MFPALENLIRVSVLELQAADYTAEQRQQALQLVFGVDTQLIEDGTYFVAEAKVDGSQVIAGCGGWSKRKTLYGSDHCAGREDALLDPNHDAAKIRAFFVHPDWARRGIGSRILRGLRNGGGSGGFPPPRNGRDPYRGPPLPSPGLRRRGTPRGSAWTRPVASHCSHGQATLTVFPTAICTSSKERAGPDSTWRWVHSPNDGFLNTCLLKLIRWFGGQRCQAAGAVGSHLLRRHPFGKLSCRDCPRSGAGISFCPGQPDQPGDQGWPSPSPPARIGTLVPMAAGYGGHPMEPVEAWWMPVTSMAAWWSILQSGRGRDKWLILPPHQSTEWIESQQENPSLNTSPAVRCVPIRERTNTRWSLPTHIRLLVARQVCWPVVCARLPCPCRRNPDLLACPLRTSRPGFASSSICGVVRMCPVSNHAAELCVLMDVVDMQEKHP